MQTERKDGGREMRIKIHPRAYIFIGIGLLLLILLVFTFRINAYDKIYPGVSVRGINIGGLSKEAAQEKISKEYAGALSEKTFALRLEDREKTFSAEDIGAWADAAKTAENAYNFGRDKGFFKKINAYFEKKKAIEPVCGADSEKIISMIDEISDGLETPVKEESFSLSGTTLIIENGKSGRAVNREKAEKETEKNVFLLSEKPITLKIEDAEPKEVDAEEFYQKIVSAEKNAYYERENGEIVVRDGFPKIDVSKEKIKEALKSGKDKYEIQVTITQPKVSAAELKALLFRDNMGSWTSKFSASNRGRTANVKLAASRINGVTLLPGEVFSYDKTIGSRTAANGYHVAGVYVGNKVEEGIGGGICQTSSTLYSAVLYSNLEIVSRTSHSLPVSYMPPGQDATIAEGSIDFKFKNNTDYPVKIVCQTGSSSVTCSIYGVKTPGQTVELVNTKTADYQPKITRTVDDSIPVGFKKIKQKGAPGFAYSSRRIVKINGVEQKSENLTRSSYKALDTIEIVNSKDKNTPSASLQIYSPEANKPAEEEVKPASAEEVPKTDSAESGTAKQEEKAAEPKENEEEKTN